MKEHTVWVYHVSFLICRLLRLSLSGACKIIEIEQYQLFFVTMNFKSLKIKKKLEN